MPELRQVDPKTLKANPQNPRKVQPPKTQDDQLDASIRAIGIIQPPIVREIDGKLVIRAGDRRCAAAVRLGLPSIDVLVAESDAAADTMIAAAENLVRASMAPTDIWRAMEQPSFQPSKWADLRGPLQRSGSATSPRRVSSAAGPRLPVRSRSAG